MYKYFLEVLFSGWEKTALLVFLTLALCVGKKPNVLFVRLGKLAYNTTEALRSVLHFAKPSDVRSPFRASDGKASVVM